MTKWEYLFETWWAQYGDFVDWLNDLGRCGWELVQVIGTDSDDYIACIFKRKIDNEATD